MDFALLPDSVIEFAKKSAGLHPGGLILHVDVDRPEVKHVEYDESGVRYIRNALVIVAAAADLKLDTEFLGT
ncbi:UNVERIFIED_CONTAM: hypothetical protein Slati_1964700 [Sesamum latifolium]|uniref:Uncharacterized protein n=1 Tax=Sesamum latifolium TaxID=2727402 RepID=A0AAW2WKQ4_9LAMI